MGAGTVVDAGKISVSSVYIWVCLGSIPPTPSSCPEDPGEEVRWANTGMHEHTLTPSLTFTHYRLSLANLEELWVDFSAALLCGLISSQSYRMTLG